MKFPRKLSKERLSLLSPEDRKIYEYEHSGLCPEMRLLNESEVIANANIGHIEEDMDLKAFMEQLTFNELYDSLFDKELKDIVGESEYNRIRTNLYEFIMNDPELKALNEAEGHACDWWVDMGWLGKLCAGLLGTLLGVIAWLFMKGMDRLALKKLKQYMNKLVELTDLGVNKKRPWYSFLCPTKKGRQNTGDYDKACFRTIQETAERNMACLYALAIHNLGFLSESDNNFNSVSSGVPEEGSGLFTFQQLMEGMSDNLEGVKLDNSTLKLLPIKIDRSHFANLQLPPVPTNFKMLMSNIDYPSKANKNPNGSLFMKPTEEILKAKGEDLGHQFFHNDNKDDIFKDVIVLNTNKNENFKYNGRNSAIQALLEIDDNDVDKTGDMEAGNLLTPDLIPTDVAGAEVETEVNPREETAVKAFKGNMIDAINNYVNASIPGITKLIRGICGKASAQELPKFALLLANLNNAAEGNLTKFFKKNDEILKLIMDNDYQKTIQQQRNFSYLAQLCADIIVWSNNKNFCTKCGITKPKKLRTEIKKILSDPDSDTKEFENIISRSSNFSNYKDLKKIAVSLKIFNSSDDDDDDTNVSSSIQYTYLNKLNEDEQIKDGEEIKKSLSSSMETAYKEVLNKINVEMVGIIEKDPTEWQVIIEAKERMTKLKDAADKEITEKIGLICRTSQGAGSDIGDKFKAALSKHPVRASALTNIWARYSDDLTGRIESRIKSITGDNGSSSIFTTIKTFLTTTYPNLIAIMLYYKSILYLVKLYTSKYPIDPDSVKEISDASSAIDIDNLEAQIAILRGNNSTNNQLQPQQLLPLPLLNTNTVNP